MIADLDETIRKLLIDELPIKNGEIDVSFDQPKREWSSKLSKPTINLFLYDLRENNILRHHGWEQLGDGNGRDQLAHLKRTPFRVDCFYMLTTWATVPEDEHRLLARALMALFRFPVLPEERLERGMRNQPFEIQTALARHDRLTNPAEVWGSLDNEMQPSISYIVTLALDPWAEVTGPIVQTVTLRPGQSSTLPQKQELLADTVLTEMSFIGGTVWDKKSKNAPLANIEVAIKGTGIFSTSDEQGRFVLGSMPPGDYTLVAWSKDKKPAVPIEKDISIPANSGEYDIDL
jgi:hypothetical protein